MSAEKPSLLVIEDNPADAFLIEEALEQAELDCGLYIVRDGQQALEFLERVEMDPTHPRPDLVFLDLNLPKISGEEILKRVRLSPRLGAAKVLIVSSSDAPVDRDRSMSLGANEYFRKPSSLEQFMALGPRIREMLEKPSQTA